VKPVAWIDDRLGLSRFARSGLNHVFPKHWSFMLGEIALYCFVVLVLTGTFLALFFEPSGGPSVYEGEYQPLHGQEMSAAFRSALELSFDVRAGLLMRQIHHWAAVVFVAAIIAHLLRVFVTGAFRRPREINWLVGVGLLVLSLATGYAGYSMLDDLLSGTGLRVGYSVALSIPFAGPWIAFFLYGGEFPGPEIINRLFVLHVFVFPLLIGGFLAMHMGIIWHQKHTQFDGPGRSERRLVGQRLWPGYTAKTLGLFFAVFAVLAALGGLAQINPIWIYGPYEPAAATTGAQPDWYLGWIEGMLRLTPGWDVNVFGILVPALFFQGVAFPIAMLTLLALWPFLEARVTGDREPHLVLEHPTHRPVRLSIAVGIVTFMALLLVGGGHDVFAVWLGVSIEGITWALRIALLVVPPAAAVATYLAARRVARSPD
jgi:ubiquinol-cytochrome c reductase cytochrome b subunit